MTKRVNNISYKGIRHTPSQVSDADGWASECANLSPDGNNLKPMPMPVKKNGYTVTFGAKLVYVHQGVGYENYIELDADGQRLYLRDSQGNYVYVNDTTTPPANYWWNQSDVLAVESMGNTLVVSTKDGTEYIIYQPDVPLTGTQGSYKPIGQKPPMPVIEFRMSTVETKYYDFQYLVDENIKAVLYNIGPLANKLSFTKETEKKLSPFLKGVVATLEKEVSDDNKFFQPFFVRYAYRMRTGDYIMQSPSILMLPSTDKCPIETILSAIQSEQAEYNIAAIQANITAAKLCYKIHNSVNIGEWSDIIDCVDIFISNSITNYEADVRLGADYDSDEICSLERIDNSTQDFGKAFVDGEITTLPFPWPFNSFPYGGTNQFHYPIKSVEEKTFHRKVKENSLFYKVASFDLSELTQMQDYEDLPIENLSNLTTLPTLDDDYYSHCAVSPSLLQVYNSRLNMANINQKVFDGFVNGLQPQSASGYTHPPGSGMTNYYVYAVWYKVKKNGKTYIVAPYSDLKRLDYTTYLYYPDPDCYEAVVWWSTSPSTAYYYTFPMKRHEYLNGAYWYDNMKCLAQYLYDNDAINHSAGNPPIITPDDELWYNIPNRFMMSSVGNPWHFPVGNQFDIGRREIRALSVNAENMDAPQFGQNPIYVFSADGIWTIAINADGTFNKLSYVSGDVLSEMWTIGNSPTASAQQLTFFKTDRGIMAIIGSQVKDISATMKGRVFNPITDLLPAHSVKNGIPTSGVESYWLDLINGVCDNIPFANYAKHSKLLYDYRNDRLLLFPDNKDIHYLYVYDVRHDFWSKMMPIVVDESGTSPAQQEYNRRDNRQFYTAFTGVAMIGSKAVLQDNEGYIWYVGEQPDENNITTRQFGFYVSRPMRFGTDDLKTLTRIVHDQQLSMANEKVGMGLYGSADGRKWYQITSLRGTAYKFFVIVIYTHVYPYSRYAYTAFEWEPRFADKIR